MSRYRVGSVTGFNIGRQPATGSNSGRRPSTVWVVLDSAVCYRIVGEHRTRGGRGYHIDGEQEAREHAARLERECP